MRPYENSPEARNSPRESMESVYVVLTKKFGGCAVLHDKDIDPLMES